MKMPGILSVCALFLATASAGAFESLPSGPRRDPVEFTHFPDRLHSFVWRNWDLLPASRIAKTIGAAESDIAGCAASMGLPPQAELPQDALQRAYLTIIRRNWHLLPYEQLLNLLDMRPDQLNEVLREDDFLWIKLGQVKPACEPLEWKPPTASVRSASEGIRNALAQHFEPAQLGSGEKPFGFRAEFEGFAGPASGGEREAKDNDPQIRLIYSYFGLYGDPLSDPALAIYPDGLLSRLASAGVNAVWLHAVLRNLIPGNSLMPESQGHATRLANLKRLVERAHRHGIGVYLYLNEPRAMHSAYFTAHPELRGVAEGDYSALCTSNPAVLDWMRESAAHVFEKAPGLAGFFTITGSENLTHCASHGNQAGCPRCSKRSYPELIAEVNAALTAGMQQAAPTARAIFWDWGWRGHGEAVDVIEALPKDQWLMSVSEWAVPIARGGISQQVGEYSLSAPGPGPRALKHWKAARDSGLRPMAKVQINSTWELSTVPYLPVYDLVAEHCARLARGGVESLMLSWTVGSYPSPGLSLVKQLLEGGDPDESLVLNRFAEERFGPGAADARRAWTAFSKAFQQYPYSDSVVYSCPVQYGPANLLFLRKTGYAATMTGIPYDDLNGWRGPYPPEIFIGQFRRMAEGWHSGLNDLAHAVSKAPSSRKAEAETELRYAKAAWLHFRSVANQAEFVWLRDGATGSTPAGRQAMARLVKDELNLALQLHALRGEDSKLGFEAANQYFYLPNDLAEKVVNCQHVLSELDRAQQ